MMERRLRSKAFLTQLLIFLRIHQAVKNSIWAKVQKKMPLWAKNFHLIWDKLSEAQADALKLEWIYEDAEKPTQEENAKKLGISIASYQERLG
jgi:hypothetical protein